MSTFVCPVRFHTSGPMPGDPPFLSKRLRHTLLYSPLTTALPAPETHKILGTAVAFLLICFMRGRRGGDAAADSMCDRVCLWFLSLYIYMCVCAWGGTGALSDSVSLGHKQTQCLCFKPRDWNPFESIGHTHADIHRHEHLLSHTDTHARARARVR